MDDRTHDDRAEDLRALARGALERVLADPAGGDVLAAEVAERGQRRQNFAALSVALRARGLAARNRDDLVTAEKHLRLSVKVALDHDLPHLAGGALTTLASVLLLQGRVAAALEAADRAAPLLTGNELAVLRLFRANVLLETGNPTEALKHYAAALRVFARSGDRAHQAMVYGNRGLLRLNSSSLRAADRDLRRAEQLYQELGDRRWVANVRQHLGMASARRGEVIAALRWFNSADEVLQELQATDPLALMDRVDALLSARLLAEARSTAGTAVHQLRERRAFLHLARARLQLAEVALLQGDLQEARAAAAKARRSLARQGLDSYVVLCDFLLLRASLPRSAPSPSRLLRATRVADSLAAARWQLQALDARLLAARTALELGRRDTALAELAKCGSVQREGPLELRSRAWHVTALLRLAGGDHRGAEAAVRAGLVAIYRYQATLAATDLRAHASEHGTDLGTLGLDLGLADGRPHRVLTWSERWRARALQVRPGRAPDPTVADQLDRLRRLQQEVSDEVLAGRDPSRLKRQQMALEDAVRRRTRVATAGPATPPALATLPQLRRHLGDHALVEYVERQGRLWAIVVTNRRSQVVPIGDVGAVRREIQLLRFGLRRLAMTHVGHVLATESARRAATHAGGRLSDVLVRPLSGAVEGRPLVLVPTASLHALPWSALRLLHDTPVTVAPSATAWLRCTTAAAEPGGSVVLAAGPGLLEAKQEVLELAALYPGARFLVGPDARVTPLVEALDGAELGHIAAHGRFRADNVQFSSLRMHDGELTVYDLENLRRPPAFLVLAACDVGMSEIHPGDELMGVAAAVLSMGTRTVIATLLPVPDDMARLLMLAFHRRLRAGDGPAVALVHARTEVEPEPPGALSSFLCLGTG
jgi:hypothetical protein